MPKENINEKTMVIVELKGSGEDLPVKISWAELHGQPGIDIRKFWLKQVNPSKNEICPSGKGVRIPVSQFIQLLRLFENKEFMKQLEATADINKG